MGAFLETLKRVKTPSGSDLRVVYVLRCFAFSNLSGIMVTNKKFFLVFAVAPSTSRNTERIGPSKSSGR